MVSYVVTGASRGIGLGLVRVLASSPKNQVFALVRNKTTAAQLLDLVAINENKNVVVLEADLEDYKTIKAAAEKVSEAAGGKLDVLINNGALLHHERNVLTLDTYPNEETLENDLLLYFRTNVIGVTHTINAFLPLLRAGDTKKVLVVSSSLGSTRYTLEMKYASGTSYSISKAAVNMVVAKYAVGLRDEGFTFVAVSPGLVKTMQGLPADVIDQFYEGEVARLRKENPNFPGLVSAEQSARDQIALLERMTPADSGAFVHANGKDANTDG